MSIASKHWSIENTPEQKEAAARAYAILAGIPANRYSPDLNDWATINNKVRPPKPENAHNCRTLGCAGGWLSMCPIMPEIDLVRGNPLVQSNSVFGCPSLFFSRLDFENLRSFPSDKHVVLYRFARAAGRSHRRALFVAKRDAK